MHMALIMREDDDAAGHAITHVQIHVQSTVATKLVSHVLQLHIHVTSRHILSMVI